jgi:hypothetical protein
MSSQQIDLENLSNREIKELWEKTRNEQRKQMGLREAEARGLTDLQEHDREYYKDNFGNMIEGCRPAPKRTGHYVDTSGYVQELAPGEKAPELSGNRLVDWLNNQDIASDPELRSALGEDNLYFETELRLNDADFVLVGRLEKRGWLVTAQGAGREFKFRLTRNLTRDEAIEQAKGYVETKAGPQFRDLTENERRTCERMAVSNRLNALVFYIQCRLQEDLSDRFLQLGAGGDELAILNFAADEKISEIVEEAVANVYYFNNIRADENFFDWVRAHDDGRMWTLTLLDTLFAKYSVETTLDKLDTQDGPTAEDLDQMSDAEIEQTLLAARKLRAGR